MRICCLLEVSQNYRTNPTPFAPNEQRPLFLFRLYSALTLQFTITALLEHQIYVCLFALLLFRRFATRANLEAFLPLLWLFFLNFCRFQWWIYWRLRLLPFSLSIDRTPLNRFVVNKSWKMNYSHVMYPRKKMPKNAKLFNLCTALNFGRCQHQSRNFQSIIFFPSVGRIS